MIIGLIVFIFCTLGVYGYYDGNIALTYIGFGLAIIEHIIGISSGAEKGATTIILSILCALGMAFAGNNLIESIAICLCFENVISFVFGIIIMLIMGKTISNTEVRDENKKEIATNEQNPIKEKTIQEQKPTLEEYEKLFKTVEIGTGVNGIDKVIQTFFGFYMEKNIPIPLELVITDNRTIMQKYENLLKIIETGLGIKGIKNVQEKLYDFYKSRGVVYPTDFEKPKFAPITEEIYERGEDIILDMMRENMKKTKENQQKEEQKSKADILIEKMDKAFIEAGLEPPKTVNRRGSLIVFSPQNEKRKDTLYDGDIVKVNDKEYKIVIVVDKATGIKMVGDTIEMHIKIKDIDDHQFIKRAFDRYKKELKF